MSNEGMKVSVHYVGTLDDGTVFDSSREREMPLEFVCMSGQMIPGFDAAVRDMAVGETVKVHLEPSEAYGEHRDDLYKVIPLTFLRDVDQLEPGVMVLLTSPEGYPVPAMVASKDDRAVTFDMNHQLAGKALNFEIELLEVSEDTGCDCADGCDGCSGCGC